jgi:GMP synthase-like glutamine amidotransferase
MSLRAHILQHVPFEGLGSIEPWLRSRDASFSYTRFFASSSLPEMDDVDFVIAMGGPMSVNDEATLSWLAPEKQFIRQAVQQGVPVLGVCLGAQLIANALGSRVYPNAHREIGWFDIETTPTPSSAFRFPAKTSVLHWHGETFELPPGAVRLARSAACENQAFQMGRNVIGLQFHLEMTPLDAQSIIHHCSHELIEDTFVHSEATLLSVPSSNYDRTNQLMAAVLAYLLPEF